DGAGRVAERGMRGHIGDTLAIDIDLASVAQAFEIFLAGEGPPLVGDDVFGFRHGHLRFLPIFVVVARKLARLSGRGKARNRGSLARMEPFPTRRKATAVTVPGTAASAGGRGAAPLDRGRSAGRSSFRHGRPRARRGRCRTGGPTTAC